MDIKEIRESGIGSNFKVVDQKDGFRNDNSIWFGNCATCGGHVSNSVFNGVWEHTTYGESDSLNVIIMKKLDYCPSV